MAAAYKVLGQVVAGAISTLTMTNYIGAGTTTVTGTVASTSGYAIGDILTISGATGTEQGCPYGVGQSAQGKAAALSCRLAAPILQHQEDWHQSSPPNPALSGMLQSLQGHGIRVT